MLDFGYKDLCDVVLVSLITHLVPILFSSDNLACSLFLEHSQIIPILEPKSYVISSWDILLLRTPKSNYFLSVMLNVTFWKISF